MGLLIQTNYRWSSTPRFIKAIFNFANLKIQTLFPSYVIKEAYSSGKPSRKPFISTSNKRVQSELGVDPRYKTLGAVTLDVFPKAPIGEIAWVGFTLGN